MVRLNKIQQFFINIKSANKEIKLGMLELPMGSVMVSEPPEPEVLGNTSESGVIELPTHKHKWTQEENRMLWKCYLDKNDKNVRVIRMLADIWRECIACGLKREAEK